MQDTQFTLVDLTFDWKETTYFIRALNELGEQPKNWSEPVNYLDGEIYGRLEVLEKPTDLEITAMFCFWQDGNEICTMRRDNPILFSEAGVYYFRHASPSSGSDEKGNAHWIRCKGKRYFQADAPLDVVQCQWWAFNDAGERKVLREKGKHWPKDEREDMGVEVRQHIPIRQRLEMIVVAAGARFSAPAHWTNQTERDLASRRS